MNSEQIRYMIRENADEIVRLHSRIHESFAQRDSSLEKKQAWSHACSEFHFRYDMLAFPGGLRGAFQRIADGEPFAMEAAVCFLEVRPYFFRSGYMYKDLIRKCKRAPLSSEQQARFDSVLERYLAYRRGVMSRSSFR
jgi:hypothetical protein